MLKSILKSNMFAYSRALECPTCKAVFAQPGKALRHIQLCARTVVVRCDVPSVPTSLVDVYHGGAVADDVDMDAGDDNVISFDEAIDLPYMVDMFHDPPTGQQERPFEEIFLEMNNNPEAVYKTSVGVPPNDRFVMFQKALVRRGAAYNPLNFRNTSGRDELDKLFNIFAFVRKYTLSMSAGE